MNLTLSGGKSDVTISGLSKTDSITQAAFDGITVTLHGAEINNLDDLKISGGEAEGKIGVRRILWQGKIDGIDRNAVIIIDTVTSGKVRGVWLIHGAQENQLTFYTEPARLTADSTGDVQDDKAAISLQFVDKKTALTPRTFTFMEKHSLLSLGSSFDHVTITAHDDIYLSCSSGKIISGVIKGGSKAKVDGGHWSFEDKNSFVVETSDAVKIYDGSCL